MAGSLSAAAQRSLLMSSSILGVLSDQQEKIPAYFDDYHEKRRQNRPILSAVVEFQCRFRPLAMYRARNDGLGLVSTHSAASEPSADHPSWSTRSVQGPGSP